MRRLIALVLFLPWPVMAAVDWTQAGVNGGVPYRTSVFTNMTGLNSTQDISGAVGAAIALCPSNEVVQLPAGSFIWSNTVSSSANGVTVRGAGTNTVIVGQVNGAMFSLAGNRWYDNSVGVTNGTYLGSTNIVVTNVPGDLVVGEYVHLMQSNDVSFVQPAGIDGSSGEYSIGQWLKVTAINGNTLTVWPPLFFSYSNQFQPFIKWPVNGGAASQNFCERFGLENFVYSNLNAGANCELVAMDFCAECWVKGVQSFWGSVDHVWLFDTYRCELRDSLFSGVTAPITSSRCYGVQVGTPNIGGTPSQSSSLLIENNRFELCRGAVVLGYGAAGCVVGYNYFGSETNETAGIVRADILVHSCFPMENLYEGNVGTVFNADRFHGNGGLSTIYRNYFSGRDWPHADASSMRSIELDADTHNFVIEANVVGYPGIGLDCTNLGGAALLIANTPDTSWNYANWYKAFMFGYDGEGGGVTMNDTNCLLTTTLTGNFNYLDNSTHWDTNGVVTLAPSLYLPAQPGWWNGSPWPAIGPDVSGFTKAIPAMHLSFAGATPVVPGPIGGNPLPDFLPTGNR